MREQPLGERGRQRLAAAQQRQRPRRSRPAVLRQHAPRRRRRLHQARPAAFDQMREPRRIGRVVARRDHRARAVQQRQEELQRGDVERQRGHREQHVVRADAGLLAHRAEQVREISMLDHHALRAPRRTRCVDHVRERRQCARIPAGGGVRVVIRTRVDRRPVRVEQHDGYAGVSPVVPPRGFSQQQRGARVVDDVREPLGRIRGIERQIGAARFQDAEQPDHHVDRALERERDDALRARAVRAQIVREAIRTPVQRRVAERVRAARDGDRLGRARRLRLEPAIDEVDARQFGIRIVAGRHHAPMLVGGQHVELGEHRAACVVERAHELLERRMHERADARRVDRGVHLRREREALARVVDDHRQRVVVALARGDELNVVVRCVALLFVRRIAVVQQRREQRRLRGYRAAALREREGRVLVAQQPREAIVRRDQARLDIRLVERDPHGQRVHEEAHRSMRVRAALHAAEQHRAEHHVAPVRRPREHEAPCDVHHARRAHAETPRVRAHRAGQPGRERAPVLDDRAAVALHVEQAERRGRLVDVAQHLAEERFVLALARAEARVRDEVAKRHRRRQRIAAALLERLRFFGEERERRMVADQMVRQHAEHPAVVARIVRDVTVHERRAADVDAMAARIAAGFELARDIAVAVRQLDVFDRQPRAPPHHLHRLRDAFPEEAGAQHVVAVDHALQRGQEPLEPLARAEREQMRFQIEVALRVQQMMEQHAFLQRRERIDVLHVRRAAVYLLRDRVDLRLGQRDERQHVGRDSRGADGDQVRRDVDVDAVRARLRGERGQRLRVEQRAHVGVQAALAHHVAQADRQQRMTAQLEEVVVAADLIDLQQVPPDLGQCFFFCALRRFVFGAGVCVVRRRGQCAPVQLAVRRQRPRVQPHIRRRHHVARQVLRGLRSQCRDIGVALVVRDEAFLCRCCRCCCRRGRG
ncbi:Uncharacterised protein [Burkholderia pseudomallei]|nr:Uncharacterised protein [Burkholderia pseudomallei]